MEINEVRLLCLLCENLGIKTAGELINFKNHWHIKNNEELLSELVWNYDTLQETCENLAFYPEINKSQDNDFFRKILDFLNI